MTPKTFEYQITVTADAIDDMQHVNNVVYLQWVQDIARNAWEHTLKTHRSQIPTDIEIDQLAWVAIDHYIQYKAPAFQDDQLAISTYVKQFLGVKSERHTTITRPSDQKLIATAVTNWCLVNLKTNKPMRVPQSIIDLF